MSRNDPFFDENDTAEHVFDEGNCNVPGLIGHRLELYAELAESVLDGLDTAAVKSMRETKGDDGEKVHDFAISAKGLSIQQVAQWIKSWSLVDKHGNRVKPTVQKIEMLKRSWFRAIQAAVQEHALAAEEGSAPIMDPTPAVSETSPDSLSTSDADDSTPSSTD